MPSGRAHPAAPEEREGEAGHCVTCSDEGTPLRVLSLTEDGTALCEGEVEVMTDLVGDVAPGETVLVHAGVALTRLGP